MLKNLKKHLYWLVVLLPMLLSACKTDTDVKVYEVDSSDTREHVEVSMTAVISNIDMDNSLISFVECTSGTEYILAYHGGVILNNKYNENIGIDRFTAGSVVDVVYYSDTDKLVSITMNPSALILTEVNKFSVDLESGTAKYNGTTVNMVNWILAYDDGMPIDIQEIDTEDQVTLCIMGDKLVSVVVEYGHGYVRLLNQDTYIGGMVEIGYDVSVPVTNNMLIPVREGTYTLRINNNGYSDSKDGIVVKKGEETLVDIRDIAIPTGTVTFNITPAEAQLFVGGNLIEPHAYTDVYGTYSVKISAVGYNDFNGSFKISGTTKSVDIELVEESSEETTEETTEQTNTTETTISTTTEGGSTTESEITTEESTTDNKIRINAPVGASVYIDGNYVGIAPVSFDKVTGTHSVVLYQSGYLVKSYSIDAVDDGTDDEYSFEALTSVLDLID